MFRKSLTVFFILLANIILLAHAVIPHHHHTSDICIVNNVENAPHDNCTTHNHEHEKKSDACALNQVLVIHSQQIRYEINDIDFADNNQSIFDDIQAGFVNDGMGDLYSINASNSKPPLLASTYSLFAGNSIGLRAPPSI